MFENSHVEIAKIWNVSVWLASFINRMIAFVYFLSLITVVGSIFFIKRYGYDKLTPILFVLSITILIFISGLPLEIFK